MINVLLTSAGLRRLRGLTECRVLIWGKGKLFKHETVDKCAEAVRSFMFFICRGSQIVYIFLDTLLKGKSLQVLYFYTYHIYLILLYSLIQDFTV